MKLVLTELRLCAQGWGLNDGENGVYSPEHQADGEERHKNNPAGGMSPLDLPGLPLTFIFPHFPVCIGPKGQRGLSPISQCVVNHHESWFSHLRRRAQPPSVRCRGY